MPPFPRCAGMPVRAIRQDSGGHRMSANPTRLHCHPARHLHLARQNGARGVSGAAQSRLPASGFPAPGFRRTSTPGFRRTSTPGYPNGVRGSARGRVGLVRRSDSHGHAGTLSARQPRRPFAPPRREKGALRRAAVPSAVGGPEPGAHFAAWLSERPTESRSAFPVSAPPRRALVSHCLRSVRALARLTNHRPTVHGPAELSGHRDGGRRAKNARRKEWRKGPQAERLAERLPPPRAKAVT